MTIHVDSDGVAHGVYNVLKNWWAQWCFVRNEDGAVRDDQVSEGAQTCLFCVDAERRFGRPWGARFER